MATGISPTAALIALAKLAKDAESVKLEDIRTEADVRKLDAKVLSRFISDPVSREHLNKAMMFKDADALAAYEKEQADAATAEQQRVADENARLQAEADAVAIAAAPPVPTVPIIPTWQAEDEENKALGVTTVRDPQGNIVRLIMDYQATDEQGNPVGRPTHLEARNWPEMVGKQREAHVQASRAFSRLKKAQLTRKEQTTEQQPVRVLTDVEVADLVKDLKSDDSAKSVAAARKLALADPAVVKAQQDAYESRIKADAALVTYQFLQKHIHDFNNCAANHKLLGEYFQENNLAWTLDNLEIALAALEDQLAPVVQSPARAVPSVEVNSAPVTTAATAAPAASAAAVAAVSAAPASQAASAQPATPPQPENRPPVQVEPRPGVNSGIQPGSLTGRIVDVPSAVAPGQLTARDIYKWDSKVLKARMRDPQWRPILEAAGIKIIDKFRQ